MVSKKQFWYLEVEDKDGNKVRYSIRKEGRSIFITNNYGYEHLKHPGYSIEDEIRIVFKAKVIRTILPNKI